MHQITIKRASPDKAVLISAFIRQVFDLAVAPYYSGQGNHEFYKYIIPEAIADRLKENHWLLLAYDQDKLLGIIEIRDNNHLSMLFIETNHQRQGIGHYLFNHAINKCKELNQELKTMTVHSSPNSITAYEHFGFVVKEPEKVVNGIRFTTMELTL